MTATPSRESVLQISDLAITFASKRGQVTALEGVDLDVQPGSSSPSPVPPAVASQRS